MIHHRIFCGIRLRRRPDPRINLLDRDRLLVDNLQRLPVDRISRLTQRSQSLRPGLIQVEIFSSSLLEQSRPR